jgi:light-regulated signal transduction histidine kinase (bacteriophytochrome)
LNRNYIELLKEKIVEAIDEKNLDYINKVSSAARRMGNLIDDLLAFSRMGRQEIVKRQIDLNLLVQEVIQEFKFDFETRDIQWLINGLPQVNGDSSLLKAVLINLLSNAIKFTRLVKHAKIEIDHYLNDNEVVVFVRDNGVGFDQIYVGKLFGVFQRLHLKDEFEGTGIGLANVRRIVEKHGGKVWAEGKVGQGATFYFSLPRLAQG